MRCRRITWLQIDAEGHKTYHATDKRGLCARKGLRLPVSDLRVLDPAYTSQRRGCVLARDRCMVVCLEHVRCIVMRDCVLLPLDRALALTEAQAVLVAALQRAIADHAGRSFGGDAGVAHACADQVCHSHARLRLQHAAVDAFAHKRALAFYFIGCLNFTEQILLESM